MILIYRSSIFVLFFKFVCVHAQVANFVTNGGFEEYYSCTFGPYSNVIMKAKGWRNIDSSFYGCVQFYHKCSGVVPSDGFNYQYPYKGSGFGTSSMLCQPPACSVVGNRCYIRNRLKSNLISGKTYCVKVHYNVRDISSYGIDSFGAYFGGDQLDTIKYPWIPLTYLSPQVQNSQGQYATDTMNWKLLTGTFVATGVEKHMVIGNFNSDAATGKVFINPTNPAVALDMYIDHVSCIDVDLPAFAGNDTSCIPGTTIYLGRQRDVGIDEACMWYKLPIIITPTTPALDTAAGIWVSPTQTSTYVVRQEICGNVKWDTVIVYKDAVGFGELLYKNEELKIFPVPANQSIELQVSNIHLFSDFTSVSIHNSFGQLIREEDILFKTEKTLISTSSLPNGVYSLCLKNARQETLSKKFVIYR